MKILIPVGIALTRCLMYCQDDEATILSLFESGVTTEPFRTYHHVYKKKYDLNSEEGKTRYENFHETLQFIKQENAKGLSFQLGITEFSDTNNK